MALAVAFVEIRNMGGFVVGVSPGAHVSALLVDVGGHEVRLGCDGLLALMNPIHCQLLSIDGHTIKCAPLGTSPELQRWQEMSNEPKRPREGYGGQPTLAVFLDRARPDRTLASAVSFVHGMLLSQDLEPRCALDPLWSHTAMREQPVDWMLDATWSQIGVALIPYVIGDLFWFWISLPPGAPRCGIGPGCI